MLGPRPCFRRGIPALVILLGLVRCGGAAPDPQQVDLFVSGEGGYHTYRIPALAVMPGGTVVALAEGRKTSSSDRGDIDLVMRRSTDHGRTWSDMRLVYEEGGAAPTAIGNPTPVVDHATGTLHLLFSRNNQRLFVMTSRDDGVTFSGPRDITPAAKAVRLRLDSPRSRTDRRHPNPVRPAAGPDLAQCENRRLRPRIASARS